ncbi:MAG TPA: DUF2939 domain-containing protein [Nitrospinaceae bacterium]|jgi:hypothetical protein|nr:DUF2939 domain-containing protein [Nitrospinaceae bacterium]|tara:strand:- start:1135 stop:1716 length:582 start_codon:yes stop_codon:yes gene_type:complete
MSIRKIFITVFSLIGFYLLWPYLAVFSLYLDLKTGDVVGVEEHIDWPSFKNDLQADLDQLVEIKVKESLNSKGIKISFDSLTLSRQLSDKIATPKGLIYLFNKPNEFIEQIRQTFNSAIPPEKINPPAPEKKSFEPEGPNIPNLFEQIEYAFFTDPTDFRLRFNKDDLPFTLDWQLQGIFWKLTRLKIPIRKI